MTVVGIQFVDAQERIRHDRATEALTAQELGIKAGQLEVSKGELVVKQGALQEQVRHDLVSEAQQEYSNRTGRIIAEANRKQAEVAQQRVNLDTYKYETTGRRLDESNIAKNYSSAALDRQHIEESKQKVKESEAAQKKLENEASLVHRQDTTYFLTGLDTAYANLDKLRAEAGLKGAQSTQAISQANLNMANVKYTDVKAALAPLETLTGGVTSIAKAVK